MTMQPTMAQNKSDSGILVILLPKKEGQKTVKMKVEDPSEAL